MDAIAALARRFPEHAGRIGQLEAADSDFRAICEDYGIALRALEHWQAAGLSSRQKAEEYRQLVEELEAEAMTILEAIESRS